MIVAALSPVLDPAPALAVALVARLLFTADHVSAPLLAVATQRLGSTPA